jgi:hypothetical protein
MKTVKTIFLVAALSAGLAAAASASPTKAEKRADARIIANATSDGKLPDGVKLTKRQLESLKRRRTLFAPAGQKMVTLEAPLGMCFLDQSYFLESVLFEEIQYELDGMGAGQLLGVFAPCVDAYGFGHGNLTGMMGFTGVITWLNPEVGETTPLDLRRYLDKEEKEFYSLVRMDSLDWKDAQGKTQSIAVEKGSEDKRPASMKTEDLFKGASPATAKDGPITGTTTGKPALDAALQEVAEGKDKPPGDKAADAKPVDKPADKQAAKSGDDWHDAIASGEVKKPEGGKDAVKKDDTKKGEPAKVADAKAGAIGAFDRNDDAYLSGTMDRIISGKNGKASVKNKDDARKGEPAKVADAKASGIGIFDRNDDAYLNGVIDRMISGENARSPDKITGKWTFDRNDDAYLSGGLDKIIKSTPEPAKVEAAPAGGMKPRKSAPGSASATLGLPAAGGDVGISYHPDPKARRTADGVTVGYTTTFEHGGDKLFLTGLVGTTSLSHVPVAVIMTRAQEKEAYDSKKVRDLMDVFLAQQVALNP